MKNKFIILIIGKSGKDHYHTEETDKETVSYELNGKKYNGKIEDSWFKKYGFLGRRFHGVEGERLIVFHEALDEAEDDPKPIVRGESSENSARRLLMAHTYRGVNPALKEQFKEKGGADIELWMIGLVLIVFIIAALVVAWKYGIIFNPQPEPKTKTELTLILSLLMRRIRS